MNLERSKAVITQGISSQAELDRTSAEQAQAVARVGDPPTIHRKTIRAPFGGVPASAR